MVVPWLDSDNEFQRTAAIVAMAVMVEGCSEHIRGRCVCSLGPLSISYICTSHTAVSLSYFNSHIKVRGLVCGSGVGGRGGRSEGKE